MNRRYEWKSLTLIIGVVMLLAVACAPQTQSQEKPLLETRLPLTTGSSPSDEIELMGNVTSQSGDHWAVDGTVVTITDQTEVKEKIAIGDLIKVHGTLADDDSFTAREVELLSLDDIEDILD